MFCNIPITINACFQPLTSFAGKTTPSLMVLLLICLLLRSIRTSQTNKLKWLCKHIIFLLCASILPFCLGLYGGNTYNFILSSLQASSKRRLNVVKWKQTFIWQLMSEVCRRNEVEGARKMFSKFLRQTSPVSHPIGMQAFHCLTFRARF